MAETINQNPTPSLSPCPPPLSAKKSKTRGSNFIATEDEAVAKAFIRCSENSIKGSEQRSETFFSEVTQTYNDFFKPDARENRSSESVKARVKTITKACTAFSGCYGRVIRMQPTGTNGTDLFRLATGLYNGTTMRNSADDCGKAFKFGLAWNVLKEYPRYSPFHADSDDSVNLGKTSEENGSNSDKAIESTDGSTGSERKDNCRDARPTGRASAKKDVEKQRIAREKIKLANEALNAQRERTAAINKHYEILLFTSGPAGSDQLETSEYFSTMRKRVLAKLRETEPKRQRVDGANEETASGVNLLGSGEGADEDY